MKRKKITGFFQDIILKKTCKRKLCLLSILKTIHLLVRKLKFWENMPLQNSTSHNIKLVQETKQAIIQLFINVGTHMHTQL